MRQESQRLREALQNLPATEVNETTRARDAAQQALGRLSSAFDDVTSEAQAVEERLSRAQEELRKANQAYGGPKAELTRAIEITERLGHVFEAAKATYREECVKLSKLPHPRYSRASRTSRI